MDGAARCGGDGRDCGVGGDVPAGPGQDADAEHRGGVARVDGGARVPHGGAESVPAGARADGDPVGGPSRVCVCVCIQLISIARSVPVNVATFSVYESVRACL